MYKQIKNELDVNVKRKRLLPEKMNKEESEWVSGRCDGTSTVGQ